MLSHFLRKDFNVTLNSTAVYNTPAVEAPDLGDRYSQLSVFTQYPSAVEAPDLGDRYSHL